MRRNNPRITDIRLTTTAMVFGFLSEQEKRGISNRTYNSTRAVLSTAFRGAMKLTGLTVNPVAGVPAKDDNSVPRKPFSIQQVDLIMKLAINDSMAGPIVITALCTGMRRSNCALLTWDNVDLARNQLNVTIRKTGVRVTIPIMPRLRQLLENTPRVGNYCFPEAAESLLTGRGHLLYAGLDAILTKIGIDRADADPTTSPRLFKVSQHGFHALKTTFITLALNAGFPIEILKKIVGNQTVDIVRNHYFQPDQEVIRASMLKNLPRELTGAEAEGVSLVSRVTSLLSAVRSLGPENFVQLRGVIEKDLVALQAELERGS
jgi:integrase